MDRKDQDILDYNNKFMKRILKSLLYTFIVFIISVWGVFSVIGLIFNNMSVAQSNTWAIISICIGIIFTIFYCTFTILDEIKK
ncbi:hypothetical protein [Caloranaerobacter sp. DY30410]|uniref:hypothetical protein n=1 Tax=Caloranaerobacter sp. DY30410 TaxID=3238305 RepID=UPI003CFBFC71